MADEASEFKRGVEQGRVEQTLLEHAGHLAKINGSIADFAKEMHLMVLATQRLADRLDADAATAVATAAALAKDEAARRARADRSWSPVARVLAIIGGVAALAAIVGVWLAQRG